MFITVRGLQGLQSVPFANLGSAVRPAGRTGGFALAVCSLWGQLRVRRAERVCVCSSRRLGMRNAISVLLQSYLLLSEQVIFCNRPVLKS